MLAEKHADAGGPKQLVARKGIKVSVEFRQVNRTMGNSLGAIHQHQGAHLMRRGNHLGDRVQGAKAVGDMGHTDQPCAPAELGFKTAEIQCAVIPNRHPPNYGASLLGHHLPGNDVGVMLQFGQQNLIPGAQLRPPPTLGHQVDALGGAPSKHDFFTAHPTQKVRDPVAGGLHRLGRTVCQSVRAPMDIGVVPEVVVADGINHRKWFLGRGRVVKVDQWVPVDLLVQYRKLGTNVVDPRWRQTQGAHQDGSGSVST